MIQIPENRGNVPSVLTCVGDIVIRGSRRWFETHRPEILGLFRDQEYERLPDIKDVEIKVRVAGSRQGPNVMGDRAVRRTVEVEAIQGENHFSFNFVVFIPVRVRQPVSAFITICNRGIGDSDPTRHFLSSFYPAETIISRGYACAPFRTQEMAPDYDEGFSTCFYKLFPGHRENRPLDAWGAIAVRAQATSRIMDYFETDPLIDEKRVAAVGRSHGGKTALWCTAQDERFAVAMSSYAGNSGDAIARGSKGERIKNITSRFPYWFCANYQKYKDREEKFPFDQHMLLALIAPRLVYTTSRTFDSWADPGKQFESCVQADLVYRLLSVPGIAEREMPLPKYPLHEGRIGYHHKTGNHDIDEYDWNCFMGFADRYMRRENKSGPVPVTASLPHLPPSIWRRYPKNTW